MAGTLAQFFDAKDPPPSYTEAPSDAGLLQRIAKLVEFATRNGPSFVDLIKTKQKDNAEYGFLFDGEGAGFYRWTLYNALLKAAAAQQQPQQQPHQQPAEHQAHPAVQQVAAQTYQQPQAAYQQATYQGYQQPVYPVLPPDVASSFQQVLAALTGSKESIHSAASWFLAAQQHAAGLAAQMATHAASITEYSKQLHVVYLANDILLKGLEQRAAGTGHESDAIAAALRQALPGILATACTGGGQTQEVKDRLVQILHFWRDKGVYDAAATAELESVATSGNPYAAHPQYSQAAWQQHQQQQAGQQQWPGQQQGYSGQPQQYPGQPYPPSTPQQGGGWYPPPDGAMSAATALPPPDIAQQYGYAPPPGAYPSQQQPGYAPPGGVPAPATPPLPNPTAFPPGLLPQLVRARADEGSYTPIAAADLAATAMPAPKEPDAYLKSRLDQFYAELQDWRPGMTRADVEEQQRRQRRAEGRPEDSLPPPRAHSEHVRTFDGPPPRGSSGGDRGGGGGGGSGRGGLGFEDAPSQPTMGVGGGSYGNVYDSFREQRSGRYHEGLSRSSIASMLARGEGFGAYGRK